MIDLDELEAIAKAAREDEIVAIRPATVLELIAELRNTRGILAEHVIDAYNLKEKRELTLPELATFVISMVKGEADYDLKNAVRDENEACAMEAERLAGTTRWRQNFSAVAVAIRARLKP